MLYFGHQEDYIKMNETKYSGAEEVAWDLSDLYDSTGDPDLDRDLDQADRKAKKLASEYKGRISDLTAEEMLKLLQRYEEILELSGKAATYAYLSWSTNTEMAERGALLQKNTERSSRLYQELLFIELEWAKAPEVKARKLMDDPKLAHYRYKLEVTRRFRPYLLSEAEEKILAEKAVTGKNAWTRYFGEVLSSAKYELDGEILPEQVILKKLYDPDRELRCRAAAAFTKGLKQLRHTTTYVFNNILADKASNDRLRSYPGWISARNLDNQVDDATVSALINAVTSRYDIVARYYRLKAGLLGLTELYDYDRYAPISDTASSYTWDQAKDVVLKAYQAYHPKMAEIASLFFSRQWIDAAVSPGKRGGAYSHSAVPSVHPYIFINFEGRERDVTTLAHELGHGVHQYLSRKQGILLADTPLTTAETASVFGEMLVFQDLVAAEKDPKVKLSMLVRKIEDSLATVFRQVAMNRFEDGAHRKRRSQGELTTEGLSEIWSKTQEAMFNGSVTLTRDYSLWWSYIPHFINLPGYVYAYAFGELLVLALYARYQEVGADFADDYLNMLSAGGGVQPEELVKPLGVDLKDPDFWDQGLARIEKMVAEAESLQAG